MAKKKEKASGWDILRAAWRGVSIGLSILMFLFFAMIIFSIFGSIDPIESGNVAVIEIEGPIMSTQQTFMPGVTSKQIIKHLERALEDEDIKAIILDINSPGGTPVATDEIARVVKEANKTTIAVIGETGASGAYWIATATDRVFANRMSVTGSIGVKASKVEIAGLMKDYNITYRRLVAGRLKDAGTMLKEMTPEEEQLFQKLLDKMHDEFISTVAENRNLQEDYVRSLATGFVYLGSEAKDLGLIDELGNKKDALEYLEETLDIEAEPVTYKERAGLFSSFSAVSAESFYAMGKGIGSLFSTDTQITLT